MDDGQEAKEKVCSTARLEASPAEQTIRPAEDMSAYGVAGNRILKVGLLAAARIGKGVFSGGRGGSFIATYRLSFYRLPLNPYGQFFRMPVLYLSKKNDLWDLVGLPV